MNFVPPHVACALLGVHRNTLRSYEAKGLFPNLRRLPGGHRRYALGDLRSVLGTGA